MNKKIILGIDPGTTVTGYGVIDSDGTPIDYGCIRPPAKYELGKRYEIIFNGVELLMDKHRPDAVAVESQFAMKNVQSAIKLGMAKGMVYLAAAKTCCCRNRKWQQIPGAENDSSYAPAAPST
jgi:crossover junction endodeoxyribonuclease RuvC